MTKKNSQPALKKLDLAKAAQAIALRKQGLYRLTPKEAIWVEAALRLRKEACEENEDWTEAARWERIRSKFD